MNLLTATVGVARDAWRAVTAKGEERVLLELVLRDSEGVESYWRAEVPGGDEAKALRTYCLAFGVRGAGVRLEGEISRRALRRNGEHVADVPFIRLRAAKFEGDLWREQKTEDKRQEVGA